MSKGQALVTKWTAEAKAAGRPAPKCEASAELQDLFSPLPACVLRTAHATRGSARAGVVRQPHLRRILRQVMELDLDSLASVRRFAAAWKEKKADIHVLVRAPRSPRRTVDAVLASSPPRRLGISRRTDAPRPLAAGRPPPADQQRGNL